MSKASSPIRLQWSRAGDGGAASISAGWRRFAARWPRSTSSSLSTSSSMSRTPTTMLRQALPGSSRVDGRMLITTPAFDWLWTSHDRLNHHIKRYTAAEMRDLVRAPVSSRSRLDISSSRSSHPSFSSAWPRGCRHSAPSVPRVPPHAVNRALQTWFRAENAIAGWLPFGSSVMAVASMQSPMKRLLGTDAGAHRGAGSRSDLSAEARPRRRHGGRRRVVCVAGKSAR